MYRSIKRFREVCRAESKSISFGEDLVLARILARHLMYLDVKDVSLAPHIAMNGYWEEWITVALHEYLRPGMNCIDVGANFGYYSVFFGGEIGGEGKLLAVEPNPKTTELLRKNLFVNGMAGFGEVAELAISDKKDEEVELVVPNKNEIGGASIKREGRPQDQVITVKTARLDDLAGAWDRVDLIKIDAEGAEYEVWKGMQNIVRENHDLILVMEFNSGRFDEGRNFLDEVVAAGFELKFIDHDGEIKSVSTEKLLGSEAEDWMLFLKRL